MDPVIPRYDRECVAAIVPAVFGLADASWLPEPAREANSVVLLVLDGLGADVIAERPEEVPTLASMDGGAITTVIPATTSAALTAITTGCAPAQHGIVGYRTLIDNDVLNVLRWQVEGSERVRAPEPFVVQRERAFMGRPVPVVTKADFRNSGFSKAHLGDGPWCGWKTTGVLVEQCRTQVRDHGAEFVYAYYPGVDEVAHEFGLHDGFYAAELRVADDIVARLIDALPSDSCLLVTADHGHVHIERDAWIEVRDLERLLVTQSGDARFRHLHAVAGAAKELAQECRDRFGAVAWVKTRRELLDEGWLGAHVAPGVAGRIGDVVLMPFAPVGFVDPALPRERELRSAHGAPTPAEMWVPLRAARGQG